MTGAMPSPLQSDLLDAPLLRHGFFTRLGGISHGIYASLNGGQGSDDDAEAVRHNRARMAAWLDLAGRPKRSVSWPLGLMSRPIIF